DWTTGKTTAIKQLGRTHELRIRARYPGSDRIPVVYVTTPPKGSPRKLAMEFARFLGLPMVTRRDTTTDIADSVCVRRADRAAVRHRGRTCLLSTVQRLRPRRPVDHVRQGVPPRHAYLRSDIPRRARTTAARRPGAWRPADPPRRRRRRFRRPP